MPGPRRGMRRPPRMARPGKRLTNDQIRIQSARLVPLTSEGFDKELKRIRTRFPDAHVRRLKAGKTGSNFLEPNEPFKAIVFNAGRNDDTPFVADVMRSRNIKR